MHNTDELTALCCASINHQIFIFTKRTILLHNSHVENVYLTFIPWVNKSNEAVTTRQRDWSLFFQHVWVWLKCFVEPQSPTDQNHGISITADEFAGLSPKHGPCLSTKPEDLISNTCVSPRVPFSSIRVQLTSRNHFFLFYSKICCRHARVDYFSLKICDYAP